jgi:hypothetical protein
MSTKREKALTEIRSCYQDLLATDAWKKTRPGIYIMASGACQLEINLYSGVASRYQVIVKSDDYKLIDTTRRLKKPDQPALFWGAYERLVKSLVPLGCDITQLIYPSQEAYRAEIKRAKTEEEVENLRAQARAARNVTRLAQRISKAREYQSDLKSMAENILQQPQGFSLPYTATFGSMLKLEIKNSKAWKGCVDMHIHDAHGDLVARSTGFYPGYSLNEHKLLTDCQRQLGIWYAKTTGEAL